MGETSGKVVIKKELIILCFLLSKREKEFDEVQHCQCGYINHCSCHVDFLFKATVLCPVSQVTA